MRGDMMALWEGFVLLLEPECILRTARPAGFTDSRTESARLRGVARDNRGHITSFRVRRCRSSGRQLMAAKSSKGAEINLFKTDTIASQMQTP